MINIQKEKIDLTYRNIPYSQNAENTTLICFNKNSIILPKNTGGPDLLLNHPQPAAEQEAVYIGKLDGISYFCSTADITYDGGLFAEHDMYSARRFLNRKERWIAALAFQLRNWIKDNRFCGRCASAMRHSTSERSLVCSGCGMTVYPKISPAVIVLIRSDERILLARNHSFPARFHSLIAGYVDIGESFEDTVAREIKEEVGLNVKNIRYYRSQPWPYSSSQMIGFTADLDGTDHITIDEKEIAEAAWFTRDSLPPVPGDDSIAGEMIEKYVQGLL